MVEEVGRLHQAVNIRPAMISLFPFFLFHFFILSWDTQKILKIAKKAFPAWFDLTWDWGYLQGCCCDPTEILKVKIIKNSQFICLLCLEPSVWWYRGLPGYKSPMIPLCSGGLSGKKSFSFSPQPFPPAVNWEERQLAIDCLSSPGKVFQLLPACAVSLGKPA